MTAPLFVNAASFTSSGGQPTDDDPLFAGKGLVTGDKILMFACFNSFAFAATEFPGGSETRVWHALAWFANTYAGVGPFYRWNATAFMHRYDGDNSHLHLNGNSSPDMVIWVAYRNISSFTADDSDVIASGADSGTLSLPARTNYVGGGTNVAWLVFCSTSPTAVPSWPVGVTQRAIHSIVGVGTFAIAEQVNVGTGDWPATAVPYSGGVLGAFGGCSVTRFPPIFRQDGDA